MGFLETDGPVFVTDSPKLRQDRLVSLIRALRPVARVCEVDDPGAALVLVPGEVILRLRSGAAAEPGALLAIRFDCAMALSAALPGAPDRIVMPVEEGGALGALAAVLLEEAGAGRCGADQTVARLAEAMLVLLLRATLDGARPVTGVLAGLSHPRLHRAVVAIHDAPATGWTVEALAEVAGMSRSRFMAAFSEVIGLSPLAYVTRWRVALAQVALEDGAEPRVVAREVGYGSLAALRRAMRRQGAGADAA